MSRSNLICHLIHVSVLMRSYYPAAMFKTTVGKKLTSHDGRERI